MTFYDLTHNLVSQFLWDVVAFLALIFISYVIPLILIILLGSLALSIIGAVLLGVIGVIGSVVTGDNWFRGLDHALAESEPKDPQQ